MNWLAKTALILVIIGAINWLLVGVFQWDLVAAIFGGNALRSSSSLSRIIYAIVGLAGLYSISFLFTDNGIKSNQ
ncbi:DUF378 domain-containing protein [Desulfosporosinus sp. PR]|uniref:DUF378 domain-containing protein n=1 Tax=Candidatus Desulfosporosinus nitrosoreducens TaxID=3401928 RepID=UPI0027EF4E67|nr:DUF378 domain-containing protein [Desulfosporosinus sp. PR]MDQ7094232.1 DUF378 domain-containing protein [Desulfosporosinus sp. PR]